MSSVHKSPCDTLAVDGAVRGAVIGVLWGGFQGTYYGWYDGVRGRPLASSIALNLAANGAGFAAFLGLYQYTHCAVQRRRNKQDWGNSAIAGLVSGGICGLPVAYRTNDPKLVVYAAGLTACFTSLVHALRDSSSRK